MKVKTLEEGFSAFNARKWHHYKTWSAINKDGFAVLTLWKDLIKTDFEKTSLTSSPITLFTSKLSFSTEKFSKPALKVFPAILLFGVIRSSKYASTISSICIFGLN